VAADEKTSHHSLVDAGLAKLAEKIEPLSKSSSNPFWPASWRNTSAKGFSLIYGRVSRSSRA
jgi:hypothetical protein